MHLSSEASVLIVDVVTDDATPPSAVSDFRFFFCSTKIAFKNRETRLRLRGNPHGGLRRRDT